MRNHSKIRLVASLIAVLSCIPAGSHAAQMQNAPTVAIIDTTINSSQFPNVIHEVCFTYSEDCPNNQASMDGPGAAGVPAFYFPANTINHGAQVVGSAILANPKVKIVFIRIADVMTYLGKPVMGTQLSSIDNAMNWVASNYKQYGINVVSISQEAVFADGSCRVDAKLTASVEILKTANVPVLAGVGNNGLQNHTAFPACSPDVIGVGASSPQGAPLYFSNLGTGVQLLALGSTTVNMPVAATGSSMVATRVAGTSIATPIAATLWATNFSGTWQNQVNQMKALPQVMDQLKNRYSWIH